MESSPAEDDVPPRRYAICNEDDHGKYDEVVIPAKIPTNIAGPYSAKDEKEGNHCENTDNSESLWLSIVDHCDCYLSSEAGVV